MVRCPYNVSHVVLKHRLPAHLVKCRRQNPQITFTRCPFNSSHDIPTPEIEKHMETCTDRKALESFKYSVGVPKKETQELNHPTVNSTEENWDEVPVMANSYLDEKDKINDGRKISRAPPCGMSKSERKAFYQAEAQRLEEIEEKDVALNSSVTNKK